ncbi:MAG: lipoprotein insertase outer membrane protein LolB [Aeromonas sp.]
MILRLLLLFCVLLGGCSSVPPTRGPINWPVEQARLRALDHWELTGKLALISPSQRGSARLHWQQRGQAYALTLTSLIGTHLLKVTQANGRFSVTDVQGNTYQSAQPQALIYQLTGWSLPLDALRLWIKGVPTRAPHRLNSDGALAELTDGPWHVTFSDYRDAASFRLPHRLELTGQEARLKLLINQWSPAAQ